MKKIIRLGHCFECNPPRLMPAKYLEQIEYVEGHLAECNPPRLMPAKYLEQIEYVEGHLAPGEIHHKLICPGCLKKALELGDVFERDLKEKL